MVARSGMFVAPLAGSPPVGMSPTDGRIAFSALIGTTPQPATGGAITQSASVMTITVAAGVWQLPDVSNAAGSSTFLTAVDQTVVTPAAGPGTGSRIDLIVVKQNNVENSDADSRGNIFLVAGTAGAPGVAPAVPPGAYLYATVNVPATVTNAAACTVVVARPSTFAPLPIASPTLAQLNSVVGAVGQHASVTADHSDYQWNGSSWVLVAGDTGWIAAPLVNSWVNYGGAYGAARYRRLNGVVYITGLVKLGSIAGAAAIFTLPAGFRPAAQRFVTTEAASAVCLLEITSAGIVQISNVASNASLSLEAVFVAEA